jgi:histidyl-tRNA synthetase
MGERATAFALSTVDKLRRDGITAECDIMQRSLKAQMKYADKIGAKYVIMLGDNEIDSGKATAKCMADSSQTEVDLTGIAYFIKNR